MGCAAPCFLRIVGARTHLLFVAPGCTVAAYVGFIDIDAACASCKSTAFGQRMASCWGCIAFCPASTLWRRPLAAIAASTTATTATPAP